MKKIITIMAIGLTMLCIPFCGGWTEAPDQSDRYVGGELIATYADETIAYKSKQIVSDISTANGAPEYKPISGIQNGCGAVAGAIAVGFYDKYYENMITDWASYYSTGRYRLQDAKYVPALINDLYTRMQTNVVAPGVSQDDFKSGLKSYVANQGYNLEYASLGQGTGFNYSTFKTAVSNNEIVVLFVKSSNLYKCSSSANEDVISTINISGNHVMIAYGYYEVKYTLSNGTRTDKYLRVSTGLSGTATALYKIG